MHTQRHLKTAVLLSGGGSTLANLLECRRLDGLPIDIELVISSRPNAGGLRIAADAGIRTAVVNSRDFVSPGRTAEEINHWGDMSREVDKLLIPGEYDLVLMAGYLSRYVIPDELYGRVLNIHPSLIPMFCGDGMYGLKVHHAVVQSGVKITGCTVHFANNKYDAGPIILQRACPVYCHDLPKDVQARVFKEECKAYPAAIRLFVDERIHLDEVTSRVFIDDEGKEDIWR